MDISTEKEDWLNSRASYYGGYVSFATAHRNKAAEMFYRDAIDRLQQKFISSVFRQLKQAYFIVPAENAKGKPGKRKPSVASVRIALNRIKGGMMDLFQDTVEKIVFRYVRRVTKEGRQEIVTALERFTGNRLAIKYDAKSYNDLMKIFIRRNVELITNASRQTISNIENIVYDGMTTGQGWADITHALEKERGISERRVKLIARDQTAKANEALNLLMQKEAGVEYFEWDTVEDERTSRGYGGHAQLNGKIYSYDEQDDYPVIDTYGNKGLPAQRPNCRCTAKAVFIFDGYHPKKQADGSYKIVKD